MIEDWSALDKFVRAVCTVEIGERVQPVIDKLVEDMKCIQKGGYDNPDLVNRLDAIESSLASLKKKLETPVKAQLKKGKAKQDEVIYLEEDEEEENA